MCWLPFKTSSILVEDAVNSRNLEVDVLTGNTVKVWPGGTNPAASLTMVALCAGTNVLLHDTTGTLLRVIVTSTIATPWAVQFSADGTYILTVDQGAAYAGTLRKFRVSDGAVLTAPYDVTGVSLDALAECVSASTGNLGVAVLTDYDGNITVYDGGSTTVYRGVWNRGLDMALVPSLGVVVADFNNLRVLLLTSVTILTHPTSAIAITPSTAVFSVALTTTSATTGLTYVWTKGGVVVGTNLSSYTYTSVDNEGGLAFPIGVTITHAMGAAISNAATLTVQVRS
jgi:hypothetical protein